MAEGTPKRRPWSFRQKFASGAILLILILGLSLGVGLGLGLQRAKGDDDKKEQPAAPTITSQPSWRPAVNETWQIVLSNEIELPENASSVTPDVSVFDIDLFDTPKVTIDTLHRLGKKVICYFSAGSYEEWRPDADQFKEEDMGKELDGWPGERWLKLSSENVRKIMMLRIELAERKGCDAIDPDNVDGYQNDNGIGLTANDSISFINHLSSVARPLKLAMGLKNAADIIPQILPFVEFSVNEQCVQYSECDAFKPFIEARKPVFHIEYPDDAGSELKTQTVDHYCGDEGDAKGSEDFSTVLKTMDLDGWVEFCNQEVEVTAIIPSDEGQ